MAPLLPYSRTHCMMGRTNGVGVGSPVSVVLKNSSILKVLMRDD